MSADTPDQPADVEAPPPPGSEGTPPPAGFAATGAEPSEEELRAAYEAELSRVSATDIIAQTVVSLINIGARRLGLTGEQQQGAVAGDPAAGRDLEQVRDAIDGARALMAILERTIPQELGPLRDALARLQMAYAREVGPGAGEGAVPPSPGAAPGGGAPEGGQPGGAPAGEQPPAGEGPGPAESSGRLWVPGR
jgi:hypothetical protein